MPDSPLRAGSRHSLGEPLPHQLAGSEYTALSASCDFNPNIASDTMENYLTFRLAMFHSEVRLYLLLTHSPLSLLFTQNFLLIGTLCKQQTPFDLHVLGTSPAFTLSHDQTLSAKFCKTEL